MKVVVSCDAERDLSVGIAFFDQNGTEIGDYFRRSYKSRIVIDRSGAGGQICFDINASRARLLMRVVELNRGALAHPAKTLRRHPCRLGA